MKRQAIVLLSMTWLTLGLAFAQGGPAEAASEAAALKAVTVSSSPAGQDLELRVAGAYTYKIVQPALDTLFIDLAGAKADGVPRSASWPNPIFSGYKLRPYTGANGQPVVRVQVDTKLDEPFVVERDRSALRLHFGKVAAAPATVASPANPAVAPALATVASPANPEVSPAASVTAFPTAPPASSDGPRIVSDITIDKRESGETFVDVSTSRAAVYHVVTLRSPARLVVDFEGARNASRTKTYPADTAVLRDVRISQFQSTDPPVVRVVADLNGNPAFDVHATPAGVRIELRAREMAKPAVPAAKAATPAPITRPAAANPVETASAAVPAVAAAKASVPEPAPEVVNPAPVVAAPARAEIQEAAKPDVQSTLPPVETSKQVAATPLPPAAAETPEALRAEKAALTLTVGKEASPQEAQGTAPATVAAPAEEKAKYTGEPISLNLKDVDLKDFFRLIHEISGLNIIVDPNVSGSVTMVLDSVPWDQALDIVLKNNRLGKALEGNVLRIAQVSTLTAEQEATTKLASARMDAAPLVTLFQVINYAKASDIAAILKTWTGGGALTRRGIVLVDARMNTLIISDVQTQIPIIQNIITKLDRKTKQVLIESRVVLATADFTRTLASAITGATKNHSGSTQYGGTTGTGTVVPGGTTPASPAPAATITPGTAAGFGAISITNASSKYIINDILAASEERDQAKTISRPTIITQNNVQGMVQQGVQVPVQTSINNTVTTQYVAATLQLTVTPQITDDGNVFMIINVQNSSVGAVITTVAPNINTQQATTQVLVPDGGTVVFGGITVTTRSRSATYVPLLGTIPILGNLFKTSNITDNDQELLFFVSPKIIA